MIRRQKKKQRYMSLQDMNYRKTTNRIGASLLIFLALFNFLSLATIPFDALFEQMFDEHGAYAASDVLSSIVYLLSFMLPVAFFCMITPKRERVPMQLQLRFPRNSALLILVGMAGILCAAIANSWMSNIFDYGEFSSEVLWERNAMHDYEGVLIFISGAIVPAFCEEFLFRGMILSNLMPYGKTTAILGSAILFGLMHQNIEQLFYATVAGVILGVIYTETKSIWVPTLLHMFNNLSSVVTEILADRLELTAANRLISLIDAAILGGGLIALLLLIRRAEKDKKPAVLAGDWEQDPSAATGGVSPQWRLRGFFSPMMVTFLVLVIIEMVLLLQLALQYVS